MIPEVGTQGKDEQVKHGRKTLLPQRSNTGIKSAKLPLTPNPWPMKWNAYAPRRSASIKVHTGTYLNDHIPYFTQVYTLIK
jgi:hypothetical protein